MQNVKKKLCDSDHSCCQFGHLSGEYHWLFLSGVYPCYAVSQIDPATWFALTVVTEEIHDVLWRQVRAELMSEHPAKGMLPIAVIEALNQWVKPRQMVIE